jgi:glycosyltransferase involved in cell wall biosynthesis
MKKTKIVYMVSCVQKSYVFEWLAEALHNNKKIDLSFVLVGAADTYFQRFLASLGIDVYFIPYTGKSSLPGAFIKMFFFLLKVRRPEIIHTHLFEANVLGLTAGWILRIKKRIHTRHHGSIHHRYFPRAVRLDKILNFLSTEIIVLSSSCEKIVRDWEGAPASKIHLISHGFKFSYFNSLDIEVANEIRTKYNIKEAAFPIIGVISRYTEWKGVQYTIGAFKELIKMFPGAHLILANAQGDFYFEIQDLLQQLPSGSFTEISFENNVAALYQLFDVFVHVPIDEECEAFGQTYIEALASGIPSVFTLSGIARDFVSHQTNALVVPFKNSDSILGAISRILSDERLRNHIIENGKLIVQRKFSIEGVILQLEELYKI